MESLKLSKFKDSIISGIESIKGGNPETQSSCAQATGCEFEPDTVTSFYWDCGELSHTITAEGNGGSTYFTYF